MTEQNLTTDADEFNEIDDTEGHVRTRNADEDANDAEDDTEGHMRH